MKPCPTPPFPNGVPIGDCFGFSGAEFSSLGSITTKLVPLIFSLASAIVIIYFLWGAFNYLKSGGSKEELQKAREMIIHSIFGFLILMFAFFMLQFLLKQLFGIQGDFYIF